MLNKCVPIQDFARDQRGTIVQIFALTMVAVCGFVGLGIDGSRALNAYSKAGAALDAAALAAARELMQTGASDTELLRLANNYFQSNTSQGGGLLARYENVQIDVQRGERSFRLHVSADISVPTTFARLVGFEKFAFSNAATVRFEVKEIELGMALDVTGSMSGQKIADLKAASHELIDLLIPDEDSVSDVSIGIAPYAGAVKLPNALARAASNNASNGCVVDRNSDRYTDYAPTETSFYLRPYVGMPNLTQWGTYRNMDCPRTEAVGLTKDKERLHDVIDDLEASGVTAGQIGTTWAWNVVSANYAGLWPDSIEAKPYGSEKLIKAVVLMTDGGFNTSFAGANSTVQAKAMCDAMRAKDIMIYAVSFRSPNHPALQYCASGDGAGQLYFEADNGEELQQAFRNIAAKLNNLRISQ